MVTYHHLVACINHNFDASLKTIFAQRLQYEQNWKTVKGCSDDLVLV